MKVQARIACALQSRVVYGGAAVIVHSINCGERRGAAIASSSRKREAASAGARAVGLALRQAFPNGRKITIYVPRVRSDHLGFYY